MINKTAQIVTLSPYKLHASCKTAFSEVKFKDFEIERGECAPHKVAFYDNFCGFSITWNGETDNTSLVDEIQKLQEAGKEISRKLVLELYKIARCKLVFWQGKGAFEFKSLK